MKRLFCAVLAVVGLALVPVFAAEQAKEKPSGSTAGTADKSASTVGASEESERKASRTPDVVYVPTPNDVVAKMLETADVKKTDVVFDLGCGDGRIPVAAAKTYGCKAYGWDLEPQRVKESQDNIKKNGVEKLVTIEEKDVFTLDLSPASVVTLYLLPKLNVKLIPQLEKLKPGSRIVSHDFDMKGVTPDKVIKMTSKEDDQSHTIYLWTTPLKKDSKTATPEE
jgi:SAM-dependent methyltransferase